MLVSVLVLVPLGVITLRQVAIDTVQARVRSEVVAAETRDRPAFRQQVAVADQAAQQLSGSPATTHGTGLECSTSELGGGYVTNEAVQTCYLYDFAVYPVDAALAAGTAMAESTAPELGEVLGYVADSSYRQEGLQRLLALEGCATVRDDLSDRLVSSGVATDVARCEVPYLDLVAPDHLDDHPGTVETREDVHLDLAAADGPAVYVVHRWLVLDTPIPCVQLLMTCDRWFTEPAMP